jgi:hypothetical protein
MQNQMSALPPIADMGGAKGDVRFFSRLVVRRRLVSQLRGPYAGSDLDCGLNVGLGNHACNRVFVGSKAEAILKLLLL